MLNWFDAYNNVDRSGSKKSSNDTLYELEIGKGPI